MNRFHQILLIGTFLPLCWLCMMAVHEAGHVAGALATGARIEKVVLHPLTISRTDVFPNPAPLLVVWAGPIVGVLVPLGLFAVAVVARWRWRYLPQFFAGFCLIANGCYVGAGAFLRGNDASDPGVMIAQGSPMWWLGGFAVVTFAFGLYLWNGLGPDFGLGPSQGRVDRRAAYASCVVLAAVVVLEFALSGR